MKALRYETYTKNVRVTVLAPGLVGEGTEFSEVRIKIPSRDTLPHLTLSYLSFPHLSSPDLALRFFT